ncbi:60S ribosomal protein L6 [Taphrina deformans PYCC 5710]|uniref:60S ribosomal protein L6 n=1 Tax=Taphrina deformans (strain PYCC 5710 / ATCC 11124 / CBS 356.35 / IMI 108563 / JCM 9778 / NBRC 8474) TaxID=1097556 RepID=R4XBL1_TAPDE|nr:60S ribosomal protein L6 [Taphrina deformans PYCC 5710]|eukprot:CCG81761.1 60S ribosomal protein L6 [Taphrina deformans PYCC 5710]
MSNLAPPKYYPADDSSLPKKTRKVAKPTKLRASLTPGTVCIILAGRFRGKRVVALKQIDDTVLISGPFKVNGVPLRRVNPAYLIATSTKIELPSSLSLEKYDTKYFAREKAPKGKKSEGDFFGDNKQKKSPAASRVEDQKTVDKELINVIKATPELKAYLASTFSLSKGDRPHLMKF